MAYKLHTYGNQPSANAILVAAKYSGIEINPTASFPFGQLPASFAQVHPMNQCPALETPSGESVFESSAIAKYVAGLRPENGLLGGGSPGSVESALIDSWLSLVSTAFTSVSFPTVFTRILPAMAPFDLEKFNEAVAKLKGTMAKIDKHLLTRTFLVGQTLTIADISLAAMLVPFFTLCIGEEIRSQFPNLMRHFNTVSNQPQFIAALGEPKLCETTCTGPPAKPVAEEPPAVAAAAKPTTKPKHPLDLLPKSSMALDELKRQYSNSDTRADFLPWFFKNIDPSGYVIYHCTYKYSNELTKTFMAANLSTGWFQRLEHLRKYLFGNVHVFGDSGEPGSVGIAGVWIMRGQEIPPEMIADATDGELYEWRKLDLVADKALIEDFSAWDGDFTGGNVFGGKVLPFCAGKTFK